MSDLGNKEIFAKNFKFFMNLHGKDRNDIVRDLGFKYSTITDWINGNVYPRIDKIEKLANYFGIEKSDLIEDKHKNPVDDEDKELDNKILEIFKNLSAEDREMFYKILIAILNKHQ